MENRLPPEQPFDAKLNVRNFFYHADDRPPSLNSQTPIDLAPMIAAVFSFNRETFNLPIPMNDKRYVVAFWQQHGESAGTATWILGDGIVAASMILGGKNDEDDAEALRYMQQLGGFGHYIPGTVFAQIRTMNRPLVATFFLQQGVASQSPIFDASVAIGTAYSKLIAASASEPLGDAQAAVEVKRADKYYILDGKLYPLVRYMHHEIMMKMTDVAEIMKSMTQLLIEQPAGFKQQINFRHMPKATLQWRATSPTTMFVAIEFAEGAAKTMLLLCGENRDAESLSLLEAKEIVPIHARVEYEQGVSLVKQMTRPLALVYGPNDLTSPMGESPNALMEDMVALAYFRLRGII
ncbi:MAG TPA: hypothetical protein VFE47_12620 [Tepidisphaeraceae bacterium]|jgi:hypothetical protein|nr:hypothetical protein [Tepidisphaeraceae bacterium]